VFIDIKLYRYMVVNVFRCMDLFCLLMKILMLCGRAMFIDENFRDGSYCSC
jgi:hypothetical protein